VPRGVAGTCVGMGLTTDTESLAVIFVPAARHV
jgi:hypothetical protein